LPEIEPSFHLFCSCSELFLDEKEGDWIFNEYYKQNINQLLKIKTLEGLNNYLVPIIQEKIKKKSNYKVEFLIRFYSGKSRVSKLFKILLDYLKEKDNKLYSVFKESHDKFMSETEDLLDSLLLSIRIVSRKDDSISEKDVVEIFEKISFKKLFKIKGNIKSKNLTGSLCSNIIFKEKVKIIGELIPKELSLSNEIEKTIGKTIIKGITLSFTDSPIKLNEIEFNYDNKEGISIDLKSDYIIEDIKEIGSQGTQYISKIINNFVKRG